MLSHFTFRTYICTTHTTLFSVQTSAFCIKCIHIIQLLCKTTLSSAYETSKNTFVLTCLQGNHKKKKIGRTGSTRRCLLSSERLTKLNMARLCDSRYGSQNLHGFHMQHIHIHRSTTNALMVMGLSEQWCRC